MKRVLHTINKRGMGVGQVFIYIVAALTFALIMIFGYKAISSFISSGEQVEFVQFKNDLESSIKKIYTEYGAVRKVTFTLPGRYSSICFVDMDYNNIEQERQQLCAANGIACDVWEEAANAPQHGKKGYDVVDENVFLTPIAPVPIKVHTISLAREDNEGNVKPLGFLCLPIVNGMFSLTVEGKGDHTEISSQNSLE